MVWTGEKAVSVPEQACPVFSRSAGKNGTNSADILVDVILHAEKQGHTTIAFVCYVHVF